MGITAFMAVFSGQVVLNSRLQSALTEARARARPGAEAREEGSRRDPRLFTMASFGQLPAAIDWIWIRVLLDDRITHVPRGTHAAIYYDLDLISRIDPAFADVYRGGVNLLAIIRDDVDGARDLLERGDEFRKSQLPGYPREFKDEYWSKQWEVPLYLAYIHLFELKDLPGSVAAFREAAGIPGAPRYLSRLAGELEQPGGQYRVGLRLLKLMLESARDERSREELARKRASLVVAQYVDWLNREFSAFRAEGREHGDRISPERAFRRFVRAENLGETDPWGGTISLGDDGRIRTSTPHEAVFGLE